MDEKAHDLPEECWELVFEFLDPLRDFPSLSSACKFFLSITSRIRSSLKITDPTIRHLPRILRRFPNIVKIDLSQFNGELETLLPLISRSGLDLQSLDISNQKRLPVDGLRDLGSNMRIFKSLSCSRMGILQDHDLIVIAESFPFFEELDIGFPANDNDGSSNLPTPVSDSGIIALSKMLKHLRKLNISGNYFLSDTSIFSVCKNCVLLEEIALNWCGFITQLGIASAVRIRPSLTCISMSDFTEPRISCDFTDSLVGLKDLTALDISCCGISDELLLCIAEAGLPLTKLVLAFCFNYTYAGVSSILSQCNSIGYLDLSGAEFLSNENLKQISMLIGKIKFINLSDCLKLTNSSFSHLTRYCPLLNEIKMENTSLGEEGGEMDIVVNHQVESLHLGRNAKLGYNCLTRIASICPNLQLLDLMYGGRITENDVVKILERFNKLRHLAVSLSRRLEEIRVDFEAPNPKLQVLHLGGSGIDDEVVSAIGSRCSGLLILDIRNCWRVSTSGVREVVNYCKRLREMNLKGCNMVNLKIVARMVFSRPSLRKIIVASDSNSLESLRELLMNHGCQVCYC